MDIKNKLILRLKLNKLTDCNILGPIILYDAMIKKGKKVELVQGWCGFEDTWGWHIWIKDDDDNIFDVHSDLTEWDTKMIQYTTLGEPEGAQKSDEIIQRWNDYKTNRKKFWNETPKKIKDFRAKFVHHS